MSSEKDQVYPGPNNPDIFEEKLISRESGFYWVKVAKYAPWSIAEWHQDQDSGYWTVPASISTLPNRFFLKIDERRIVREDHVVKIRLCDCDIAKLNGGNQMCFACTGPREYRISATTEVAKNE